MLNGTVTKVDLEFSYYYLIESLFFSIFALMNEKFMQNFNFFNAFRAISTDGHLIREK